MAVNMALPGCPVAELIQESIMGSYKNVTTKTTVSASDDACSQLEELGNECREIVDNAEGGLRETQRIQTFDETAGTLEGVSAPDVPECIAELPITVITQQSTRKGRGESRNVRCQNEVAVLQACEAAAQEWYDDEANAEHEDRDDVDTFITEIQNIIGDAENCEFPGMFG